MATLVRVLEYNSVPIVYLALKTDGTVFKVAYALEDLRVPPSKITAIEFEDCTGSVEWYNVLRYKQRLVGLPESPATYKQ